MCSKDEFENSRTRIGRNNRYLVDHIPANGTQLKNSVCAKYLNKFPFFNLPGPGITELPSEKISKDFEVVHYAPPPPMIKRDEFAQIEIPTHHLSWHLVFENTKSISQLSNTLSSKPVGSTNLLPPPPLSSEIFRFSI